MVVGDGFQTEPPLDTSGRDILAASVRYRSDTTTDDLVMGLARNASGSPEAACLITDDRTITFGQFARQTDDLGGALLGSGLAPGDRVAILAPATPLFFTLLFACAKARLILVPINNRLSTREIADVLADAKPRGVVVAPSLQGLVAQRDDYWIMSDDNLDGWLATAPRSPLPQNRSDCDTMLLLYTSGTTGTPKGVELSERNLSFLGRMARELWSFDQDSANFVFTPLFHIGGIGWGLLALSQGGRTIVSRESEPSVLLNQMKRHEITHTFMVPTMIQRLVEFVEASGTDAPRIRHLFYGAAPIGDALLRRALAVFECAFHHVYGMTETAGTVVTLDPVDHDPDGPERHRLQSCGRALPWVEIAVVDPATGDALAPGQIGEVRLRSDAITRGYWRKPDETRRAITPDGWLCTGDAGELDVHCYLYLRDRYKDMIVSGGENIYPKEIENVLQLHPAVSEVAVIGVAHSKWGETPAAYVVPRAGTAPSSDELIAFTRERLARYKAPSQVVFVNSLPRNASGKVQKHLLRAGTQIDVAPET